MTRFSPWLSWSVTPYHLMRLNKQISFWQPLLLKNRYITLHLRWPPKAFQNPLVKQLNLETDPVFSVVANNYTLVTCAQRPEKSAASATKPAISQTSVSRPPTLQNHPPKTNSTGTQAGILQATSAGKHLLCPSRG